MKPKHKIKNVLLWIIAGIFVVIIVAGIFLYNNFNQLLSGSLIKSFNSTLVSDVYELKINSMVWFDRNEQMLSNFTTKSHGQKILA